MAATLTSTARPNQGIELRFVRHQLDWLGEQRRNGGFSPEDEIEYHQLLSREGELLHLGR
jgi:hypothetical protein